LNRTLDFDFCFVFIFIFYKFIAHDGCGTNDSLCIACLLAEQRKTSAELGKKQRLSCSLTNGAMKGATKVRLRCSSHEHYDICEWQDLVIERAVSVVF
jgi:hypothetical protein